MVQLYSCVTRPYHAPPIQWSPPRCPPWTDNAIMRVPNVSNFDAEGGVNKNAFRRQPSMHHVAQREITALANHTGASTNHACQHNLRVTGTIAFVSKNMSAQIIRGSQHYMCKQKYGFWQTLCVAPTHDSYSKQEQC